VEFFSNIGSSFESGLAYVGELTSLALRAAYFTFIGPFHGKPVRFQRAVGQAMEAGVRALPILSLITFFIGLILALQAAYE
jgi:phospholipid/cholesterol/gamma-HCH transport system permease protein